jgi:transcriptional regulator with XRE-family HTH domain
MLKTDEKYRRRVKVAISRLKRYYKINEVTLREIAAEIGTPFVSLRKWWDGVSLPRIENLEKIERFLRNKL